MAKVLLLTTAAKDDPRFTYSDFERLTRAAAADAFRVHELTGDPGAADVILFVGYAEGGAADVRRHPFFRKWREKAFVFDSGDVPLPLVPGVYVCTDRSWYSRQRTRGGFYLRTFDQDAPEPDLLPDDHVLFSFMGKVANAPVRRAILALRHDRSIVREVDSGQTEGGALGEAYEESIRKSAFVLCPRGLGTSTWRLFETMKAGRAPVILSDAWVPPEGPEWPRFSLRIRESDAARLPELLAAREAEAAEMGKAAREAWEAWGSREVAFHRVVEWCLDIVRSRRAPERLLCYAVYPHLLRPYFLRHIVAGGLWRTLRRR